MPHNAPFCPECGHKMERIFRSNSETPRLFLCRECGHEQRRYGEPWSRKDIQFGIFTELLKIRVLLEKADARRENSPPCGVITLSKSLLHIRQQNYKMKGEEFSPPFLFTAYSVSFPYSAWTLSSLFRLIAKYSGESSMPM